MFPALNKVNTDDTYIMLSGGTTQKLVTNTAANAAPTGQTWYCVTPIADTVFTTLTGTNFTGTVSGVTFPAGVPIFGDFSTFTLASGKVMAYSRPVVP